MKVWIVSEADDSYYGAYNILKVFLDYSKAVAFAKTIKFSDIEEYEVDA